MGAGAARVERLEVRRRPRRELLHLEFAHLGAARGADRPGGVVERAPGRLGGRQAADAVGVALLGQVERGVRGVQVGLSPAPVGQSGDGHLAEDRGERPGVPRFHRPTVDAVGVDDLLQARLALGAQVQVVLVRQAEQLPALGAEAILQLGVAERGGPVAIEEADHLLEAGPAPGEAVLIDTTRHRSSSWWGCAGSRRPYSVYAVGLGAAGGAAGRQRRRPMAKPDPDKKPWAATRRSLAHELGQIDGVLPGSLVVRQMRCGKPGCACKADPPALHGPYIQWTRTVDGKTVTRFLSQEQLARYQPWFDNARKLKELVAKLEIVSVHTLESEDRRAHTTQATNAPERRSPRHSGT